MIRKGIISLLALALLSACGKHSVEESDRPSEVVSENLTGRSAAHGSFSISLEQPSLYEVVERATEMASLLGADVEPGTVEMPSSNTDLSRPVTLRLQDDLNSLYVPDRHELLVMRPSLARDNAKDPTASAAEARAKFADLVAQAQANGLLSESIDMTDVAYSTRKFAVGRSDQAAPEAVVNEYRFAAQASINGIPNSCIGIRGGIHKFGEVSFLSIMSACTRHEQTKKIDDAVLTSSLTTAQTEFAGSHPDATVVNWATSYIPFISEKSNNTLEPYHVVEFVTKSKSDGRTIISRKQSLAYSALDGQRKPVPLLAPNPDDVGDPRP